VITILLAEDHTAVRASLAAFFEAQDDFDVVATASDGREAVALVEELAPDLVLMDIRMPTLDGIEATRLIKAARPETRIVLLSAYEQDDLVAAGTEAGAEGFMLKGVSGAELVAAIRSLRSPS
jgi:DNA-binding NarL/FixJ family response regulator